MKFITQSADFTSKRQTDILVDMVRFESRAEHGNVKAERKLIQTLIDGDSVWGRDSLRDLDSKTALTIIVQAACDQGGISGLGNLEDTLIKIAQATTPDADLSKLYAYQGITDQPSPENVLLALERLATETYPLSSELEDAYLQNLELKYTSEIISCEQESSCVNDTLESAVQQAVAVGIDGEKISKFRKQIAVWAYLPETEAV